MSHHYRSEVRYRTKEGAVRYHWDEDAGRAGLAIAWWITTFPGLAIMLTVLAINILGDGM